MSEKKRLAFEIVKILWGENNAIKSQKTFEAAFQEKKPAFSIKVSAGQTLAKTITPFTNLQSATDAKRFIKQNAVDVNGQTVSDPNLIIKAGDEIKVGSRTFLKAK